MRFVTALLLSCALLPDARAGVLVFDTISGDPDINIGNTPRTYMGQDFSAAAPPVSYSNIRASVH